MRFFFLLLIPSLCFGYCTTTTNTGGNVVLTNIQVPCDNVYDYYYIQNNDGQPHVFISRKSCEVTGGQFTIYGTGETWTVYININGVYGMTGGSYTGYPQAVVSGVGNATLVSTCPTNCQPGAVSNLVVCSVLSGTGPYSIAIQMTQLVYNCSNDGQWIETQYFQGCPQCWPPGKWWVQSVCSNGKDWQSALMCTNFGGNPPRISLVAVTNSKGCGQLAAERSGLNWSSLTAAEQAAWNSGGGAVLYKPGSNGLVIDNTGTVAGGWNVAGGGADIFSNGGTIQGVGGGTGAGTNSGISGGDGPNAQFPGLNDRYGSNVVQIGNMSDLARAIEAGLKGLSNAVASAATNDEFGGTSGSFTGETFGAGWGGNTTSAFPVAQQLGTLSASFTGGSSITFGTIETEHVINMGTYTLHGQTHSLQVDLATHATSIGLFRGACLFCEAVGAWFLGIFIIRKAIA